MIVRNGIKMPFQVAERKIDRSRDVTNLILRWITNIDKHRIASFDQALHGWNRADRMKICGQEIKVVTNSCFYWGWIH